MSDFKLYRLTPFLVASVGAAKLYLLKQKKHACVVVLDGDKVLLLRRSITDSWKPCKWALPGGGVEKDENFIDAAIRELKEETHLDIDEPKKLQLIKVSPNGKIAFYLARNIHKGDVNLDQASHGFEHEDFHWATKKELEFMRLVPDLDELLSSILST